MRILDLGCGTGCDLSFWGVTDADVITGLDINSESLAEARLRFPSRSYYLGSGEAMPFPDSSFDRVVCGVALPYMNIPQALGEIYRVLIPGGSFSATLHPPSFTISELRHNAFPHPLPTLFRVYVLGNGVWFHCTGRTLGFINGRTESFQTVRGTTLAFNRQKFANVAFHHAIGPAGKTLTARATK